MSVRTTTTTFQLVGRNGSWSAQFACVIESCLWENWRRRRQHGLIHMAVTRVWMSTLGGYLDCATTSKSERNRCICRRRLDACACQVVGACASATHWNDQDEFYVRTHGGRSKRKLNENFLVVDLTYSSNTCLPKVK